MRTGPRHPRLGNAGFRFTLPLFERFYAGKQIYRQQSAFAQATFFRLREKLARGDTLYLGGLGTAGSHNSGVALIKVTRDGGPELICNNEEERFSGEKHSTRFPAHALAALRGQLQHMDLTPERIDAWFASWDYPALGATLMKTGFEEAPVSFGMLSTTATPAFNMRHLDQGTRSARRLAGALGLEAPVPIICLPHHDNHAWFSYATSPFARSGAPVMMAVLDGLGDTGSISLYHCEGDRIERLYGNDSLFDSLGIFYAVISSTQGGWTWLSSEGRYMGATAYGNSDRATNPYYARLKDIFSLEPDGRVLLNRTLANWPRSLFNNPYTPALRELLGEPITLKDMWNPDAVLSVDDISHSETTQERVDKAAATQLVFEDALFHVVEHFIRRTGGDRLILTGGIGLNALGNMRMLERFDHNFYRDALGRDARLHLWVPPTPNDAGVTIGAAYMGAYLAGAGIGPAIDHAFYCGTGPTTADIQTALDGAPDIAWVELGNATDPARREALADLMAFITAKDAIFAVMQGPAETGPRALGHRSILANPCNPKTRELLNAQVKFRETIRPLAPMMTLAAARQWFDLSDGASDDDYNAYNYMVLTARAKPAAYDVIPSVIHADGTGRIQIVRRHTDPLIHAYLAALGRRIGVEIAVNTSFNVGGPIAQTTAQAIATLRRARGLDAVLLFSEEGPVFAVWQKDGTQAGRFSRWYEEWSKLQAT
jgi:carbamoyltransferase